MFKNKSFLAIIPARGKSKRIPKKNLKPLAGKPLVEWTIEAAKKSKYIDEIVLSSDDNAILSIGKKLHIKTIKRPDEIATDTSKTIDAVIHVINNFQHHSDYIVLLQPTSPLRNETHIDESIEFLFSKKADAVISVCETEFNPLWSNTLPDDLSMKNFLPENVINKRSQDLPKFYRLNGAIFICKTEKLLEEKTFFIKDKIYAYIMDKIYSIDIDDEFDFTLAEFIKTTLINKS